MAYVFEIAGPMRDVTVSLKKTTVTISLCMVVI